MSTQRIFAHRPEGRSALYIIWLGQMVSGVASSIATVALPIWIFNLTDGLETGLAIGLWEFFYFASYLIFVQFAGVFIDRLNRRVMMMIYDILSLGVTAALLAVNLNGDLQVWHLYIASIIQGIGYAFQSPSYSAVISVMIPRRLYIHGNGLMSLLDDAPEVIGPMLAGVLVLTIGLNGVLLLNIICYFIAIAALLIVEIPATPHTQEGEESHGSYFREVGFGLRYIYQRRGLFGLHLLFFFGNLFFGMALSIAALYPMLMLRSGEDVTLLGVVQSDGAMAAMLASLYLTLFGGIKRPVHAVLWGWIIPSLVGLVLLGIGQSLFTWVAAIMLISIFDPVVNVSLKTLLQSKVPPDLQGRVFSASDFIAQAAIPFAPIMAGYLGYQVFEPAIQSGGAFAEVFGGIAGYGAGAGFGLMILLCGLGGTVVSLAAYLTPAVKNLDETLPDYVPAPPVGLVKRETPLKPE
jgi:MFS family permease